MRRGCRHTGAGSPSTTVGVVRSRLLAPLVGPPPSPSAQILDLQRAIGRLHEGVDAAAAVDVGGGAEYTCNLHSWQRSTPVPPAPSAGGGLEQVVEVAVGGPHEGVERSTSGRGGDLERPGKGNTCRGAHTLLICLCPTLRMTHDHPTLIKEAPSELLEHERRHRHSITGSRIRMLRLLKRGEAKSVTRSRRTHRLQLAAHPEMAHHLLGGPPSSTHRAQAARWQVN